MGAGNRLGIHSERLRRCIRIAHVHAIHSLHAANGAGDGRVGRIGTGQVGRCCIDAQLIEEGISLRKVCRLAGVHAKSFFQLIE